MINVNDIMYLHTASNQKLGGGKAWERGYLAWAAVSDRQKADTWEEVPTSNYLVSISANIRQLAADAALWILAPEQPLQDSEMLR